MTNELVDGVVIPLADDFHNMITDSLKELEWLPHIQRICAEAAAAQPATCWNVAMAFHEILNMLAYWDFAPEASVAGIN